MYESRKKQYNKKGDFTNLSFLDKLTIDGEEIIETEDVNYKQIPFSCSTFWSQAIFKWEKIVGVLYFKEMFATKAALPPVQNKLVVTKLLLKCHQIIENGTDEQY